MNASNLLWTTMAYILGEASGSEFRDCWKQWGGKKPGCPECGTPLTRLRCSKCGWTAR